MMDGRRSSLEVIPGAGRLMTSLRDMGYEFATAVADLVDNSIEAGSTEVSIDIEFEGTDSWVRVADNGRGMTALQLREAMRYGASRRYSTQDLGKFGLGLKVASLSQCRRLAVASSRGRDRGQTTAYRWDLDHIEKTNRWELIELRKGAEGRLFDPLKSAGGTVVLWQHLDRVLAYEYPNGESARRRLGAMARELEGHLSMVFHRFLSGEVRGRPTLRIIVNGTKISPWDPFARKERATKVLDPIAIPVSHAGVKGHVKLEPFVLPHQAEFSSAESFRNASGPANWNQQQGFYIYRADRLIQSGGWSRIRTLDEHTKLARVALRFSPQLDEVFRVNVAKMRVLLPPSLREPIAEAIAHVTQAANEAYRKTSNKLADEGIALYSSSEERASVGKDSMLEGERAPDMEQLLSQLLRVANQDERQVIRRVAARLSL